MPITWQNINPPSNADVMQGFTQAGLGITGAFDAFGKALAERQAANQGIQDRTDDTAVLNLKEALAGAKTPEAVDALQGQLAAMRGTMNIRGRTAALGAEDARTSALQTQILAKNKFNDEVTDNKQQPIADQITALYARGDKEGGDALLAANPDMRQKAILAKDRMAGDVAVTGLDQSKKKFADDLLSSENKRINDTSNAAANTLTAATGSRNTDALLLERLSTASTNTAGKLAEINKGTIGQDGFSTMITNLGKTITDKDKLDKTSSIAAEAISRNFAFRKLPTDVVEEIVLKHTRDIGAGFWNALNPRTSFSSTVVDKMVADMTKAVQDNAGRVTETDGARASLVSQLKQQRKLVDEAQSKIYPDLAGRLDAAAAASSGAPVAPAVNPVGPPVPADATVVGGQTVVVAPGVDVPALNAPPTLRTESPVDSPAGRFQARVMAAQQTAASTQVAQTTIATDTATKLIAQNDVPALTKFQDSPLFNNLDRATKGEVARLVNGGAPKKVR